MAVPWEYISCFDTTGCTDVLNEYIWRNPVSCLLPAGEQQLCRRSMRNTTRRVKQAALLKLPEDTRAATMHLTALSHEQQGVHGPIG
jgi:hypothetical protein